MDFRYVVHGQDNPLKRSVCTFTNHNDMLTYRRQMFEGLKVDKVKWCTYNGNKIDKICNQLNEIWYAWKYKNITKDYDYTYSLSPNLWHEYTKHIFPREFEYFSSML